jgi:hypothetical protein
MSVQMPSPEITLQRFHGFIIKTDRPRTSGLGFGDDDRALGQVDMRQLGASQL